MSDLTKKREEAEAELLARGELEALRDALKSTRDLHTLNPEWPCCIVCEEPDWPCPTEKIAAAALMPK